MSVNDHWLNSPPTFPQSSHRSPTLPNFAAGSTTPPESSEQESWDHQSDEVYRKHDLPQPLDAMDETDRLGIAYVYEACDVIQDELNIALRRYQQMVLMTRAYQLRVLKTRGRLQKARQDRDLLVNVALRDVTAAANPSPLDTMRDRPVPSPLSNT